ncbi:hypothetical protein [Undibacterium sp. Ren11W]|uniref:hypothetical protein n=1 Tax=Undibacterium sp. Ren11W TaxID=3413045 RepID=UPI003BEFE501
MIPLPNMSLNVSDKKDLKNDTNATTGVDLSTPWNQVKNIQIHGSGGTQGATASVETKKDTSGSLSDVGGIPLPMLLIAGGAFLLLRSK